MKDISLIRQLNEMTREKDPFEKALEEAGIEFDLGDQDMDKDVDDNDNDVIGTDDETGFEHGEDPELERIADHWREEGADMDDDELRDAIGDDLEQLDYSPEEISDGIDKVMSMLDRGEDYGEPEVDDRQEYEDFEQSDDDFGGGSDERM